MYFCLFLFAIFSSFFLISAAEDIRNFCQFLEYDYTGHEGEQWLKGTDQEKKLKLRGLVVSFRHGDRATIRDLKETVTCEPMRSEDQKEFREYQKLAESDDVIKFLNIDPEMESYKRVPDYSKCVPGNLTAIGALQHLKLGKFFNRKYSKSSLLKGDQKIRTQVSTTKYYRTLQSALAFSTGFLYEQREKLENIFIKATPTANLCQDDFCHCPAAIKMRDRYESEHNGYYPGITKEEGGDLKVLEPFEDFKNEHNPFKIIDIALGRFICRRRNLPCVEDNCITIDYLNKVVEVTTQRAKYTFDENIGVGKRFTVMDAYPILFYTKQEIENIRKFPKENFIRIFSAHDSTVGSLLKTLGMNFVEPPHFTSRLVFEIYEHLDEGLYIRFLYNGQNRSEDVRFCQGNDLKYGMCRATAFEQFINYGILDLINVKSYKDACF